MHIRDDKQVSGGQRLTPAPSTEPQRTASSGSVYQNVVKPIFDRILGGVLLVLAAPIIGFSALVVLIKMGRPVMYVQDRVGLDGQPFRLYKLRTMIPDRRVSPAMTYSPERRKTHKSPEDPRVIPFGKTLRQMRLDELPQFFNVVKGDMSLVGPRPEMPEIVESYESWQHRRHSVKPGVTGPWQISKRNGRLMSECTGMDLEYVANITLRNDLRILASTPFAMVGRRKGY